MKIRHSIGLAAAIAAVSAFGVVAVAVAQQHGAAPVTKSLQEHPVTADDLRLHAFYDLLVDARAKGAEKVDASLEKKVREMARTFPAGHAGLRRQRHWAGPCGRPGGPDARHRVGRIRKSSSRTKTS